MNQNKKEFNRNWSLSDDMSEIKLIYPLAHCKMIATIPSHFIFFPKKISDVNIKTEGGDINSMLVELDEMRNLYVDYLKTFNTIDLQCYYLWFEILNNIIEFSSPNPTMLYIMQNQDGLIKIGKSKDPQRRRNDLQYQLGDSIQILKILNHHKYEKDIHKVFQPFNAYYKGGIEWFTPYPELIKWIDEVNDDNFEKIYKKICRKNLNTQKKKSLML
jgi:hypothetical protein